ncbi:MAG: V-type ATP synthase subunit D [Anaerolineae bacterium]
MSPQMAPTRSNLMSARRTLKLAREGHDILDKKREALTSELLHIAHDASQLESEVRDLMSKAYEALEVARLVMGREHLEWAALSVNKTMEVDVMPRTIMGVMVPMVTGSGGPPDISYGMGNTTVHLDEVAERFQAVLRKIPELAQTLTTAWRLARDLQKTQRRVNALEHVFIPEYEDMVSYIESVLEEREREELFRLKRVKSRHGVSYESDRPRRGDDAI